ncbi:MAG: cell division protein FtsX [Gemmatimonadota bacterium]
MRLALREALLAFRRAPLLSVLSVTTIAVSLFAFGLFGLVAVNLRSALQRVEERVEVRAFLAEGTPADAAAAAIADILVFPEVATAEYVTPERALARARTELGEFEDVFEAGVLPGSIELRLREGQRAPATVAAVARRLRTFPFVDDVRYGAEWVEKLYRLRTIATVDGLALGAAFAAVAVIIIGTTIRMTVLARAREISLMRLVGATDGFIRLPFLLEGLAKGVLGGGLALGLLYIATRVISAQLIEVTFFDPPLAAGGVLAGALLGFVGSAVSVGRQLRRV